jgi:hypothetical protein
VNPGAMGHNDCHQSRNQQNQKVVADAGRRNSFQCSLVSRRIGPVSSS